MPPEGENFETATPRPPAPQVPFVNLPLEMGVLGACLVDPDAIALVSSHIQPSDFHDQRHRWIYAAMARLFGRQEPIDAVRVVTELGQDASKVGFAYLAELSGMVHVTLGVEQHAQELASNAVARRTFQKVATAFTRAQAMDRDEWMALAASIGKDVVPTGQRQMESADKLAKQLWDVATRPKEKPASVPTNLVKLDSVTGGLTHGVTVIAGRSGMGKTALAHSIARKIAKTDKGDVLFFSVETNNAETFMRMASQQAALDYAKVFRNDLDMMELEAYRDVLSDLSSYPMHFLDVGKLTPMRIRAEAIRHKASNGLALVVVDYIQAIRPDRWTSDKRAAVGQVAEELRDLARDLRVPVVACSQVSRESEKEKRRPVMSDLAESQSIENVASQVIFPFRPYVFGMQDENGQKYTADFAEYIVAKNRNGRTGKADTTWTGKFVRYEE